jgi:hypothetical protein
MKFEIDNKSFDTKGEASFYFTLYFKNLWKNDTPLSQEDKKTLIHLLSSRQDDEHPTEKIKDFRIITSKFGKYEVQYTCDNNTWTGFSVNRCIVGKTRTKHAKQMTEMRGYIYDQIKSFRDTHPNGKCLICQNTNDIEVDHISPIFSVIVERFTKLVYEKHIWVDFDTPLDMEVIEMFREYHQDNATYRYLCKDCNMREYHKRGKKNTMSKQEYIEKNKLRAKIRSAKLQSERLLRKKPISPQI